MTKACHHNNYNTTRHKKEKQERNRWVWMYHALIVKKERDASLKISVDLTEKNDYESAIHWISQVPKEDLGNKDCYEKLKQLLQEKFKSDEI